MASLLWPNHLYPQSFFRTSIPLSYPNLNFLCFPCCSIYLKGCHPWIQEMVTGFLSIIHHGFCTSFFPSDTGNIEKFITYWDFFLLFCPVILFWPYCDKTHGEPDHYYGNWWSASLFLNCLLLTVTCSWATEWPVFQILDWLRTMSSTHQFGPLTFVAEFSTSSSLPLTSSSPGFKVKYADRNWGWRSVDTFFAKELMTRP